MQRQPRLLPYDNGLGRAAFLDSHWHVLTPPADARPDTTYLNYEGTSDVAVTVPTSDTLRLVAAALYGLKRIYKPGFKYAKARFMLTELQAQGVEQGDLFAPEASKRDRLMAELDAVNDRFGRNTLRVGNVEGHQAWHMAQNAKTPSYTTDWGDLPVAR
ncbi:DUF4113 domain-containing protein [Burkholderia cenocepacia]|uniref:DUF4113 domain-containing protein n=1 Tax=Burkholderia cenocepacia TaxID=95486 RepID=UPI00209B72CC|nr:DUF4113 domain-containing protein [Burkholderia cenocepacia]